MNPNKENDTHTAARELYNSIRAATSDIEVIARNIELIEAIPGMNDLGHHLRDLLKADLDTARAAWESDRLDASWPEMPCFITLNVIGFDADDELGCYTISLKPGELADYDRVLEFMRDNDIRAPTRKEFDEIAGVWSLE